MEYDDIKTKVQKAYQEFAASASKEKHDEVIRLLQDIHQDSEKLVGEAKDYIHGAEFAHVATMLDKVPKGSTHLPSDEKSLPTRLKPNGELLGVGKWELLDPGWALSFEQWLAHLENKAPFNSNPQTIDIPDEVSIAVCGDWGTGPWKPDAPSTKVAKQMVKQKPDLTIHLGDVYYAGTRQEEVNNLVDPWPMGTLGGLTLNSNHEMYNGAHAYFSVALKKKFHLQKNCSYFCLRNSNWLIIGLDTAYHAPENDLYLKGKLNHVQRNWLAGLPKDKKIILLSHHEGQNIDGQKPGSCFQDVVQALGRAPDFWYWGHLHNAIVYQPYEGMLGRCVGHGAVPYGDASMLKGKPAVVWYENRSAGDPEIPLRVKNGFAMLELKNATLSESLIDEDGGVPFQATHD